MTSYQICYASHELIKLTHRFYMRFIRYVLQPWKYFANFTDDFLQLYLKFRKINILRSISSLSILITIFWICRVERKARYILISLFHQTRIPFPLRVLFSIDEFPSMTFRHLCDNFIIPSAWNNLFLWEKKEETFQSVLAVFQRR